MCAELSLTRLRLCNAGARRLLITVWASYEQKAYRSETRRSYFADPFLRELVPVVLRIPDQRAQLQKLVGTDSVNAVVYLVFVDQPGNDVVRIMRDDITEKSAECFEYLR